MEQFSLERLEKNIADAGQVRTQAILEGLLRQHYYALALDQDEYADGMDRMAQYLWNFHAQRAALRQNAISLPPIPQMKARILEEILKPDGALPPRLQDRLRTRTGQPPPAPPRQEKAPAVSLP